MKCSNAQCSVETSDAGLCDRCKANLSAFQTGITGRSFGESEILHFLTGEADGLHDMSIQEARLYDDIAEFGERELKPFELNLGSQMLARYKKLKRAQRL